MSIPPGLHAREEMLLDTVTELREKNTIVYFSVLKCGIVLRSIARSSTLNTNTSTNAKCKSSFHMDDSIEYPQKDMDTFVVLCVSMEAT